MQGFHSVVSLTFRLGITYVEGVGRCDSSKINFVKQLLRLFIKQLQCKSTVGNPSANLKIIDCIFGYLHHMYIQAHNELLLDVQFFVKYKHNAMDRIQ